MITIQVVLAAMLSLGVGTYFGQQAGLKEALSKEPERKEPMVWPPSSHERMLKLCAITCGEDKLKSYNTIYGKCQCK